MNTIHVQVNYLERPLGIKLPDVAKNIVVGPDEAGVTITRCAQRPCHCGKFFRTERERGSAAATTKGGDCLAGWVDDRTPNSVFRGLPSCAAQAPWTRQWLKERGLEAIPVSTLPRVNSEG